MENSNSLSNSILQSNAPSASIGSTSIGSSSDSSSGIFGFFQNINGTTWVIIILILAFLGFNIFAYLAQGTQDVTNFLGPFIKKIFGATIATTSQVIDVSAEGAKKVVSGTANVIDTGLTDIQNITPNPKQASSSVKSQSIQGSTQQQPDIMANNTLNKALNTSHAQQQLDNGEYEADIANSSIQGGGKAGWCYIGEDRGFRSCSYIKEDDKCMSGEIFPSKEICVNPSLRA